MMDLDALRDAIAESPKNVPLLLLYAHSCLDELSVSEARKGFEKVLEMRPDNSEAKLGIASLLFLDGRTSEAVVRAQSVLQEEPGFAPAHLFLSRLYLSENDHDEAVKHYRKALKIGKGTSDPALERALAAVDRNEPGIRGGSEDRVALHAPMEMDWRVFGDDDRQGEEEDGEEEMPSFFDELDGYDEGGRISTGFSLADFQKPDVRFAVVGGMESLKEEIRMKIVYPLQRPELFRAYGKRAGGSILLYGPPGCGKTLVSRAIAGETSAQFFEVGLRHVLEMYVGNGEKNLHQIFELARRHAPSVIFIDELDSLAADRSEGRQGNCRSLIHQLLQELDGGCVTAAQGIFVIGATSAPWNLDETVFHPGRFNRKIKVPLPDRKSRKAILKILADDKPIMDLDLDYLAARTEGYSGADLKAMFDMATEKALGIAIKEDRIVPLTMAMLMQCAKRVRLSASRWERRYREAERDGR